MKHSGKWFSLRFAVSQRGIIKGLRGVAGAETGELGRYLSRLPSRFTYLASAPMIEVDLPGGGVAHVREVIKRHLKSGFLTDDDTRPVEGRVVTPRKTGVIETSVTEYWLSKVGAVDRLRWSSRPWYRFRVNC